VFNKLIKQIDRNKYRLIIDAINSSYKLLDLINHFESWDACIPSNFSTSDVSELKAGLVSELNEKIDELKRFATLVEDGEDPAQLQNNSINGDFQNLLVSIEITTLEMLRKFHSFYFRSLNITSPDSSPIRFLIEEIYNTITQNEIDDILVKEKSQTKCLSKPLLKYSSFKNCTNAKFTVNLNEKWIPFNRHFFKKIRILLMNIRHSANKLIKDPWREDATESNMWFRIIYEVEYVSIEWASQSNINAVQVHEINEQKKRYEDINFEVLRGEVSFKDNAEKPDVLETRIKIYYL
jgi:hypothetical protein